MKNRDRITDELDCWLLSVSEGTSSAEDFERFNDLLASDKSLREYVVKRLMDESLLAEQLQVAAAESILRGQSILPPELNESSVSATASARKRWVFGAIALAACVLLVVGASAMLQRRVSPENRSGTQTITNAEQDQNGSSSFAMFDDEAAAILTRSVDVKWAEGQIPLGVDASVRPDTIRLAEGLIQLEFFSGATVVVEAPAEITIQSPMRCDLAYGKVTADVPPQARGFTIGNHSFDAVDLGTEFAMRVDRDGRGEVHVLDGEVRLQAPDGKQMRMLRIGEAVRHEADGELADLVAQRDSFVGIAELGLRAGLRLYINDLLTQNMKIRNPKRLRIGNAEIGNWHTSKARQSSIRSLNGLIDEMAVFSRVLSEREIQSAFEAGDPYQ